MNYFSNYSSIDINDWLGIAFVMNKHTRHKQNNFHFHYSLMNFHKINAEKNRNISIKKNLNKMFVIFWKNFQKKNDPTTVRKKYDSNVQLQKKKQNNPLEIKCKLWLAQQPEWTLSKFTRDIVLPTFNDSSIVSYCSVKGRLQRWTLCGEFKQPVGITVKHDSHIESIIWLYEMSKFVFNRIMWL